MNDVAYLLSAPADTDARDGRRTQPRSDVLIAENEVLFGSAAARMLRQNVGLTAREMDKL
jgi:hypothetical protein